MREIYDSASIESETHRLATGQQHSHFAILISVRKKAATFSIFRLKASTNRNTINQKILLYHFCSSLCEKIRMCPKFFTSQPENKGEAIA